jgi:hypothetical protein
MLALSVVGKHWFKPYTTKLVIYCFYAKHSALMSKSKDWLAPYQDNNVQVEQRLVGSVSG